MGGGRAGGTEGLGALDSDLLHWNGFACTFDAVNVNLTNRSNTW
jgi:hypothetical protein